MDKKKQTRPTAGDFSRHGGFSLKWGLVGIILACWILPILIILGALYFYISTSVRRQVENTVAVSAQPAIELTNSRLEAAVAASRAASYDMVLWRAWTRFQATPKGSTDRTALYDDVTDYLTQQYQFDKKFRATILYFCGQPDKAYYTGPGVADASYTLMRAYLQTAHERVQALSPELDTRIAFLTVGDRVYMVRNLLDSHFRPYAVLVMDLDRQTMFGSLSNVIWEKSGLIRLNGTDIVLSGEPDGLAALAPENSLSPGGVTGRGDDVYVHGQVKGSGFMMEYLLGVDGNALTSEFSRLRMAPVLLLLALVPLVALAVRFFYRHVTQPIVRLMEAAGEVEGGNFGVHVKGRSSNREFRYLENGFNEMSDRIKYQFERIYREELALRDARIMALQSQINPHFLNNTLEIINWEARMADDLKVSHMIESLSTMLDAAMDRKGRPTVHLSEELMYVDAYLHIISERLGKRLTIQKEISPETLDLWVPRLVMQPVIENAVEHGIVPRQKGVITLRARQEGGCLILEVENDGEITPEDEARIARLLSADPERPGQPAAGENSYSLGIRNVNQRLQILYGRQSGLSIRPGPNGGTLSRIVIALDSLQIDQ